jgi:hypothetical protein
VAFRPAQVHPQQHLGPVGGLCAARTGADRQEGGALVVLTGEQQRGPFAREGGFESRGITLELGLQLGIGSLGEEVDGSEEVVSAAEQSFPQGDLLAQPVGFAEDLLRGSLIVPEARLLGQYVELADASVFGREVKASPRSLGSARPGRGWRMRPPSSGPGDPGAGSA